MKVNRISTVVYFATKHKYNISTEALISFKFSIISLKLPIKNGFLSSMELNYTEKLLMFRVSNLYKWKNDMLAIYWNIHWKEFFKVSAQPLKTAYIPKLPCTYQQTFSTILPSCRLAIYGCLFRGARTTSDTSISSNIYL